MMMYNTDERFRFIKRVKQLQDENALLQRRLAHLQNKLEEKIYDVEFSTRLIATGRRYS